VPGVTKATYANWFGGMDPNNLQDFFATIAVEPRTMLEVYDDLVIDDAQKQAWFADRQGAIIGKSLAGRKGWKVGDKITLMGTIFPGDWTFNVRGIYQGSRQGTDLNQLFFHWDYLNESLPAGPRRDQLGWMIMKIEDEGRGAEVGRTIDAMFEDSENATLTQSELALNRSFMAMFDAILTALNIVSIVILLIMMLILGNTIAMGVRERTREYGTMRAIGFMPSHIARFIQIEAAFIGLVGGGLGVLLGLGFINGVLSPAIADSSMVAFFPAFHVAPQTILAALGLSVGLALSAASIPAWRASRLHVVDALRQVR
jgi:putative ABC transport system permease protein